MLCDNMIITTKVPVEPMTGAEFLNTSDVSKRHGVRMSVYYTIYIATQASGKK